MPSSQRVCLIGVLLVRAASLRLDESAGGEKIRSLPWIACLYFRSSQLLQRGLPAIGMPQSKLLRLTLQHRRRSVHRMLTNDHGCFTLRTVNGKCSTLGRAVDRNCYHRHQRHRQWDEYVLSQVPVAFEPPERLRAINLSGRNIGRSLIVSFLCFR